MSYSNDNFLKIFSDAKSWAVIGASRDRSKVGHQIFRNLLTNKKLDTFPVNPSAQQLLKHTVYRSILDIPASVDVAVVVVPAAWVAAVIDECIEKKVKGVIIISTGFAETSKSGKQLQLQLTDRLNEAGIPLIGPNSLGVLFPHQGINATFAGDQIEAGHLGLISQSGAMLTALFSHLESSPAGCSFALSLGNKAGLTEVDGLRYAANDLQTKVIACYLESLSSLPEFFALASQITLEKPIIVLKGGRSRKGQKATVSHTAALATNYELLKAASRQMGFVLVDTIEELIQSALFLEQQRDLPENVMILTNAGGPGVNTTDLFEQARVTLTNWSDHSLRAFAHEFPQLKPGNPFDLLGDANTDRFRFALRQAQRDMNVDAIHLVITQQAVTDIAEIVKMIGQEKGKKPILVSLIGGDGLEPFRQKLRTQQITAMTYPNQVTAILRVTQLSRLAKYQRSMFTPNKDKGPTDVPATRATSGQTPLIQPNITEAFHLLQRAGLQVPKFQTVVGVSDVKVLQLPAFAKTSNLSVKHKKKLGAIYGIVNNQAEARMAYHQLKKFGNEVLFQSLIEIDVEILLGAQRDPQFGPYLTFGLGGSQTNILKDRSYVFLPATKSYIASVFRSTLAYELVKVYDTENGTHLLDQLLAYFVQFQRVMLEHPEIVELEINPLVINSQGIWAADVKMSVG